MIGQREGKRPRHSTSRPIRFTPLQYCRMTNAPINHLLTLIKDNPMLEWLRRMKGDPSKQSKHKYGHYHHDHGQDMKECYDLKQQIEILVGRGKL